MQLISNYLQRTVAPPVEQPTTVTTLQLYTPLFCFLRCQSSVPLNK